MVDVDVIVIGAGYGGVALGALLAQRGRTVAVIEKSARAGGKSQTVDRLGWRYEMFGAVGIPGHGSRFHELVETLDITERAPFIIPNDEIARVRYKHADGTWRSSRNAAQQSGDPESLERMKATYSVDDEGIGAFGNAFLTALVTEGDALDALDDVDMLTWLQQFSIPTPLLSQICGTLNMLFVVPVDRLCASEGVFTLRQLAMGGAGRYHAGGYGHVAEVCAERITELGGRFVTSRRVQRIIVENGRAVGVVTKDGEIRARAVVSNAGIQPTVLKLCEPGAFDDAYLERVRSLEPSMGLAGVRYVLDAPVFDSALSPIYSDQSWLDSQRFAAMTKGSWPDVPLIAIDSPSMFDPSLVPAGHQLAATQVFVPSDPDSTLVAEAIRRSEVVLEELFPGFREHVVRTEPYGPRQVSRLTRDSVVPGQGGEAVGIAQVVGQCGSSKPDPRTPLPGLYLVGADAGGRGAGTHMAVDSAFNVAAMVDADLG